MTKIETILQKDTFSSDDRITLLSATDQEDIERIGRAGNIIMRQQCGAHVYYRGLVEFSNRCISDCYYCGIRRSNNTVQRYDLKMEDIVESAKWCAEQGYGSIVFQSGERQDTAFTDFVATMVSKVKEVTKSDILPEGLGITLCVGEQTLETYRKFRDAGAHRYLLRIETANRELFRRIHPEKQRFETRVNCLRLLQEAGFQVGTGVMIGIPGQTFSDLSEDIGFFSDMDIDMIGMGPFIPHEATPLGIVPCKSEDERIRLSLLMIAVTRLTLKDVNIAATTALQALDPQGREKGLSFGANIIMPQLTPLSVRSDYLLYPGKPCLDESVARCKHCLEQRIKAADLAIGYNQWGDSIHVAKRWKKR